jgi:hypothetical protein
MFGSYLQDCYKYQLTLFKDTAPVYCVNEVKSLNKL